ncbi:MAG TPA: hypothetical protein PLJ27_12310, partial [Polyangiaceae bacterium]|nr:hypothetical protein [Polyangiaceae bacterium]
MELKLFVENNGGAKPDEKDDHLTGQDSYRRIWRTTVLITLMVAIAPLVIMTAINYFQYQKALTAEMSHPTSLILSRSKRSLEFFLAERISALRLVVKDGSLGNLCDQDKLALGLRNINASFGGFIDLGSIDQDGFQCAYVGPYPLIG